MQIFDFNLFDQNIKDVFKNKHKIVVNTINAYSYVLAKENPDFYEALSTSEVLLPDGVCFSFAALLLYQKKLRKVAGFSFFIEAIQHANKNKLKVFFLGSTKRTLDKIEQRLRQEYVNIDCYFLSPSFVDEFNEQENEMIIREINKISPNILFVGMTAPKQELWTFKNQNRLTVDLIANIGAVFDFFGGSKKRAPKIFIMLGLEWLYRLITDRKHMSERYKKSPISQFIFDLIKAKTKG